MTILKLHAAIHDGRIQKLVDGLPSPGYVFAAARHAAFDSLRRKTTQPVPLDAVADIRGGPDPAHILEQHTLRDDLAAALATLDEDHRSVFVLSELEGLRYEDIATALNVPAGTVASRKHTAVRRLRRELEGMGHAL